MTPGDSIFQLQQDGCTRELTETVTPCIRFAHVQVRQGPSLEGKNWGPNPNQELITIDTSCKGIISYLPWIATGQTPYLMVIGQHKINPVVFVHLLLFGLFLSYWSFVFCGGFSVLFLLCGFFSLKKKEQMNMRLDGKELENGKIIKVYYIKIF